MADEAAQFPAWLRTVLVLALVGLLLAYMAAPLFGVKAEMPKTLEWLGAGAAGAVLGGDVWARIKG